MSEHHLEATGLQTQHEQMARSDRTLLASHNHGRPAVAATARPGEFHGAGVAAAREAHVHADRPPDTRGNTSYNASTNHSTDHPQTTTHANTANPSNGNRPQNNENHANSSRTLQQTHENNRPPEHESRPGHEGGHGGR